VPPVDRHAPHLSVVAKHSVGDMPNRYTSDVVLNQQAGPSPGFGGPGANYKWGTNFFFRLSN
jgi:hypothetical protein